MHFPPKIRIITTSPPFPFSCLNGALIILIEKFTYAHLFVVSYVKNCCCFLRQFLQLSHNLVAQPDQQVLLKEVLFSVKKVAMVCHFVCQNNNFISQICWRNKVVYYRSVRPNGMASFIYCHDLEKRCYLQATLVHEAVVKMENNE